MKVFEAEPKTRREAADEVANATDWEQVCVCVAFISQHKLITPLDYMKNNNYRITQDGLHFISILERLLEAKEEFPLLENDWSSV